MIKRAYIDTSVIAEVFDKEFAADTIPFFEAVKRGEMHIIVSDLLETELLRAPDRVRMFLNSLPQKFIERIPLTERASQLADMYPQVKDKTIYTDHLHVAIATMASADVLLSWDFKNIVNFDKINGYNIVNSRLGHNLIKIKTPKKFLLMMTENDSSDSSMIHLMRQIREGLDHEIKNMTFIQKRAYLDNILKPEQPGGTGYIRNVTSD